MGSWLQRPGVRCKIYPTESRTLMKFILTKNQSNRALASPPHSSQLLLLGPTTALGDLNSPAAFPQLALLLYLPRPSGHSNLLSALPGLLIAPHRPAPAGLLHGERGVAVAKEATVDPVLGAVLMALLAMAGTR